MTNEQLAALWADLSDAQRAAIADPDRHEQDSTVRGPGTTVTALERRELVEHTGPGEGTLTEQGVWLRSWAKRLA